MKEAKVKATPKSNKWKAVNPKQFKEWFNDKVPGYKDLCEGKAVSFNEKTNIFKQLNNNKVIVKE